MPRATARLASARCAGSGSSASTPAARVNGLSYGHFIQALKTAKIELDRKILADIAIRDAATFAKIVAVAKAA